VTTSIYNLILGKLYCDHYGTMRIQGNGEYSCKLKFKEQSIIDRNPHQVISSFASILNLFCEYISSSQFLSLMHYFKVYDSAMYMLYSVRLVHMQVQGVVQDRSGQTVATLFGKWDESMHYVMGDCFGKGKGSEQFSEAHLLWKRSKPPKFPTRYNLTRFAITLNELTPGLKVRTIMCCIRLHVKLILLRSCS
jgi:oxysterol-binding protein 1